MSAAEVTAELIALLVQKPDEWAVSDSGVVSRNRVSVNVISSDAVYVLGPSGKDGITINSAELADAVLNVRAHAPTYDATPEILAALRRRG